MGSNMALVVVTHGTVRSMAADTTLHDEQRAVAHRRILRAAVAVLKEKGLAATVDDVAIAGNVSRRTVFRYFQTRGRLLATAIDEVLDAYAASIPTELPEGDDLDEWLLDTAARIHALHADLGRLFWGLHLGPEESMPELDKPLERRRQFRDAWSRQITDLAWAAVSTDQQPEWLCDALLMTLSAYTTNALIDAGRPVEEIPIVTSRMMRALLDSAVLEQSTTRTVKSK